MSNPDPYFTKGRAWFRILARRSEPDPVWTSKFKTPILNRYAFMCKSICLECIQRFFKSIGWKGLYISWPIRIIYVRLYKLSIWKFEIWNLKLKRLSDDYLRMFHICSFPKGAFIYDVRCFLGIFDLPTYPNQMVYYIGLFSKIRCSLTYLPTQKSDVIYECSLILGVGRDGGTTSFWLLFFACF